MRFWGSTRPLLGWEPGWQQREPTPLPAFPRLPEVRVRNRGTSDRGDGGLAQAGASNLRKPTPSSTCRNGKRDVLEDASAGLRHGPAPWGSSTRRRPNPRTGSLELGDWHPPSLTSLLHPSGPLCPFLGRVRPRAQTEQDGRTDGAGRMDAAARL